MRHHNSITKLTIAFTLVLATMTCPSEAWGQKFKLFSARKSVQAAQQIKETDGNWFIMCYSFAGDDGVQQATRLAQELSSRYKLNTFLHTQKFNFAERVQGLGQGWQVYESGGKKMTRPIQMRTAGSESIEETAVLVGPYPSVEDSKAQKMLQQIKSLKPESLKFFSREDALQPNALAGAKIRAIRESKGKPLDGAFLLPNPLLPDEYFEARKIDDFVLNLNKGIKFSLLENDGIYTVRIATFTGGTTLNLNEIDEQERTDAWLRQNRRGIAESKLVDAAKKATILTAYLRKQGIEAYTFHDRHESLVCVGGFDWLTRQDADGQKNSNPEIVKTILQFKGEQVNIPGKPGASKTYKLPNKYAAAGIACDVQPLPVLVRKRKSGQAKRLGNFLGSTR